jgi:hypothetical protein
MTGTGLAVILKLNFENHVITKSFITTKRCSDFDGHQLSAHYTNTYLLFHIVSQNDSQVSLLTVVGQGRFDSHQE